MIGAPKSTWVSLYNYLKNEWLPRDEDGERIDTLMNTIQHALAANTGDKRNG